MVERLRVSDIVLSLNKDTHCLSMCHLSQTNLDYHLETFSAETSSKLPETHASYYILYTNTTFLSSSPSQTLRLELEDHDEELQPPIYARTIRLPDAPPLLFPFILPFLPPLSSSYSFLNSLFRRACLPHNPNKMVRINIQRQSPPHQISQTRKDRTKEMGSS